MIYLQKVFHEDTKITEYFENKLQIAASTNSLMGFLNTYSLGLRGRHQPALANMFTTWEVRKSRSLLSGNYLTIKVTSDAVTCQCLADEREKILAEFCKNVHYQ